MTIRIFELLSPLCPSSSSKNRATSTCLASMALLVTVGCAEKSSETTYDTNTPNTEVIVEKEVVGSQEDQTQAKKESEVAENKVLRHAVFLTFNEDSSEAEIQSVTDAFAALPNKIAEIIDFQWGVNNSPEGLDDGFTHCFLLTFKDEAGRDAYLPHPAHAGEFADQLRPHMKDVFVIDYWGTQSETDSKKELKHAVFFKFKDDADPAEIKKVEEGFAALPTKIDSIKAFEWGTNNSPEQHDDGFTHCFMVTFDAEEGRDAYLPNEDHLAFVEVLKPVLDKVRVLDFWEQ